MGSRNRYPGINEYAVDVIKYKAKKLIGTIGFTIDDLEDIEQDLMIDLLQRMKKYDGTKAQLNTYIDLVVSHKIATMIEERLAEKRDLSATATTLEELFENEDGELTTLLDCIGSDEYLNRLGYHYRSSLAEQDRRIDLDIMFKQLPIEDRRILTTLMKGSVADAARELGMPRTTLAYKLQGLRKVLFDLGLDERWRQDSSF